MLAYIRSYEQSVKLIMLFVKTGKAWHGGCEHF
jgi:hypothetical protein